MKKRDECEGLSGRMGRIRKKRDKMAITYGGWDLADLVRIRRRMWCGEYEGTSPLANCEWGMR